MKQFFWSLIVLITTPIIANVQWIPAGKLAQGYTLKTNADQIVTVLAINRKHGTNQMYNLTVNRNHDFFVSSHGNGVLVHNCEPEDIFGEGSHLFREDQSSEFLRFIKTGPAPGYRDDSYQAYTLENIKADVSKLENEGVDDILLLGDAPRIKDGTVAKLIHEHSSIRAIQELEGIPLLTEDYLSPSYEQAKAVSNFVGDAVKDRRTVYLCCGAGIGRTGGYVRAALGDFLKLSPMEAIHVGDLYYPKTWAEMNSQLRFLTSYLSDEKPFKSMDLGYTSLTIK